MLRIYKYQHIVDEMIDLIIEGYSSKDSFALILEKFYIKNEGLFLTTHDCDQIFCRGAGKAAIILEQKRKEGSLNRKPKTLKNHPLFAKNKYANNQTPSSLLSNNYNKPLLFKEKVIIQYNKLNHKYSNRSKALNETIKYFKIDTSNPSDKRLNTILKIIRELDNENR